jgi:RNA recognition motif-containing protein
VKSATVIRNKFTWQSWGFGFVEMSTASESKQAIAALREDQLGGRCLTVNEARRKEEGFRGCFYRRLGKGSVFDQNGRDVRGRSLQCFLQLAGGREVPISTTAINVRERAK